MTTENMDTAKVLTKLHERDELTRRGAKAAAAYLELRDYDIVAKDWECAAGTADLVALDDGELVFVRVKTRSGADAEEGFFSETATDEPREKWERIAAIFLRDYHLGSAGVRFDAIGVIAYGDSQAFIRHRVNVWG